MVFLKKSTIIELLIIAIILSIVPAALGFNSYYEYLAAMVVLTAIMVLAWNIIGGYAGQLDLAASAYLGTGAAVSGLLMVFKNITPWVGMPLGALAAVGLAVLIGYPTFRFGIREVWYALLTASLVIILQRIFWLIYGSTEIYLPSYKWSWYYLRFYRYEPLYYLLVGILIIVFLINIKIKESKLGYYLAAIREDELAAEALGIDVRKYKLYALMIYAAILGFVGGIYVNLTSIITYRMFDLGASISIAVMGIVGGLGSIEGALVAAVLLRTVEEYLRSTLGAVIPGLYLLVYGLLIIVVGILKPEGLGGVIERMRRRFGGGIRE